MDGPVGTDAAMSIRGAGHRGQPKPGRNRIFKSPNQLSPRMLWGEQRIAEITEDTPSVERSSREVGGFVFAGSLFAVYNGDIWQVDLEGESYTNLGGPPGGGSWKWAQVSGSVGVALDNGGSIYRQVGALGTSGWTEVVADDGGGDWDMVDTDLNGTWVAVRANGVTDSDVIRSADDGMTWTSVATLTPSGSDPPDKVIHDRDGRWVIAHKGSSYGELWHSTDGATWTLWDYSALTSDGDTIAKDVGALGGRVACAGGFLSDAEIIESSDLSTKDHTYSIPSRGASLLTRTPGGVWWGMEDVNNRYWRIPPDGGAVTEYLAPSTLRISASYDAWTHNGDRFVINNVESTYYGLAYSDDDGITFTQIDSPPVGSGAVDCVFSYHAT